MLNISFVDKEEGAKQEGQQNIYWSGFTICVFGHNGLKYFYYSSPTWYRRDIDQMRISIKSDQPNSYPDPPAWPRPSLISINSRWRSALVDSHFLQSTDQRYSRYLPDKPAFVQSRVQYVLKVICPPNPVGCQLSQTKLTPHPGWGQYVCLLTKSPETCFFVHTQTHRRQAQCSTFVFVAPAVQQSELKTMKSNCIWIHILKYVHR